MAAMCKKLYVLAVAIVLAAAHADAADINMRVFKVNDYLTAFYDGRPPQPATATAPTAVNWADYGAINVGVATYVIHRGDQALVYDSYPYRAEAQWVRDYLTKEGIRHFTLVNSHWHLDHVGGNAVYADSDRIATHQTIELLTAKRAGIESGKEWGLPAINPLVIPNIGIGGDSTVHVGDITVELRPVNIHSEDGLVIYLPRDRILLAGDTLEDSATFISEPEHVITQYANMRRMREWDIERIFPNHGNPDVIGHGGYQKTLIDATLVYLRRIVSHAHDPDFLNSTLEDYVAESVQKGWVSIWWAYHEAHQSNLKAISAAWKDQALPDLPP